MTKFENVLTQLFEIKQFYAYFHPKVLTVANCEATSLDTHLDVEIDHKIRSWLWLCQAQSQPQPGWENKICFVGTRGICKMFRPRESVIHGVSKLSKMDSTHRNDRKLFIWSFSAQMHSYFYIPYKRRDTYKIFRPSLKISWRPCTQVHRHYPSLPPPHMF